MNNVVNYSTKTIYHNLNLLTPFRVTYKTLRQAHGDRLAELLVVLLYWISNQVGNDNYKKNKPLNK